MRAICCGATLILAATTFCAGQPGPDDRGWPVQLDGRTVLRVAVGNTSFTAPERAMIVAHRLAQVAADEKIAADAISVQQFGDIRAITAGDVKLMEITAADAKAAGRDAADLANEYTARLRDAVRLHREHWSWQRTLRAWGLAAGAAVLFVAALILLSRLVRWARRRALAMAAHRSLRLHKAELLSARQIAAVLGSGLTVVRWIVTLVLIQVWASATLRLFPATEDLAASVNDWVMSPLVYVWTSFLDYLPNLLFTVIIGLVAYYIVRFTDFVFEEIAAGQIVFEGFYPEWAEPTSKLVRALVLVLALVMAFPYLPGSKSPAFQGVSIFVGVLLSLGSSSAVGNAVAGTILTYMRAFQLGDRVRIGDTTGDVVERTLLVTRLRTIKNVVVTIPNSTVMGAQVQNFSELARQNQLILNTSVTIGYDAPWRQIHKLLIEAALRTPGILPEPQPFVLQTALSDFYVSYEINAYTNDAQGMANIYGAFHQNIQDCFNEAGVEIMSPHYASLRDGNTMAIPESYRPENYRPDGFRVDGQ